MSAKSSVASVFLPHVHRLAWLYEAGLIAGGSLLVALAAQVAVGWPIPFTGQTFAVLMIGTLYGARRGALCLLVYLAEGLSGLPVFAQGCYGPGVLLGPRGGYLIGFVFAAYVVGRLAERGWDRRFASTALAMIVGNAVIYLFGLLWLSHLVGLREALAVGLIPFVAGDLLKTLLAAVLLPAGWELLGRLGIHKGG
jgi:biotin transport system substrate-specific component